jgi:2-phosphosulfolactate phosphatase
MSDVRAQWTYQVRLDWGVGGLSRLADAEVVIVIDAIRQSDETVLQLAAQAAAQAHQPTVFVASLRNATATAQAAYAEQLERGGRTAINLVLAGDESGGFAVEDYLAAGAIGDALTARGIDHTAPDLAVAIEGFRSLTRAVKHLFSASAAGQALGAEGRREEVKVASELDADTEAIRP